MDEDRHKPTERHRALGKVILLGEHAVVYGHPALAGAIDRGVNVRAAPAAAGPTKLAIAGWDLAVSAADDGPVAAALAALIAAAGAGEFPLALTGEADLPPGAGLGSSAALSVAVARAVAAALGRAATPAELAGWANAAERHFHARPSGIDVALAAGGGVGLFRRGAGLTRIDGDAFEVAIGLSGEARRTADMVEKVAAARQADPAADAHLAALGDAARRGADALAAGDLTALGRLMTEAHRRLAALGVSTPRLDDMVDTALAAGACGAKLTGGGGGGAVVALAPGRERAVARAWRGAGAEAFVCRLGMLP